jgi:alpha-tubulin suppressor-like RCC1 family protein
VAIAAGGDQSCALNTAGAVICWGDQSEGAGGDNLSYVTTPAYESGLSTGVTALAVGYSHACAIAAGGAVKCWGDNDDGQLGNGTFNSSSGPVTVSTFASQASSVTAGDYHSCALRLGTVSCWGNNISGQLGDGLTGNPATTAVAVSNLTGAVAVAAGTSHTCAITDGGAVQCWGANDSDQLGTTFAPGGSSTPVPVTGLGSAAGVAAVAIAAGGDHSCVLSSVGGVYCWGSNTYGELGSSPAAAGAVQVTGLDAGMVAIAAGQHSSCAQSVAGDVVCWGYGGDGELGGGSVGNTEAPQNLDGGSPAPDAGGAPAVVSLAVGAGNSLALTATGQALAWGENLDGQLGSGDLVTRLLPTPMVALDAGVVSISTGTDHGCATLTTGTVLCWGSNDSGQLGNGSTTNSLAPVAVTGLPAAATAVACGGSHSCAIAGGALYCWGENSTGELGNGTTTGTETPGLVVGLDGGVAAVQANQGVTCALTQRGDLFCWGQNPEGLLGNGNGQIIGNANGIPSTIPAQVTGLASGVTDFSIGSNHGCAVIDGGAVECWGQNFFGELGDGNAVAQGAPVPVNGLASGFKSVTVGDQHSCALNQQGGVFCWGRGSYGEMGNGMTTDQNDTPTAVTGLASGVLAVAAGDGHTCALTDGGLLCWGYNGNGSLGTGTLTNEALPTPVQ